MPTAAGKVLAPVMLDIDGRLLGPVVGITFTAGSSTNGIQIGRSSIAISE
jgi:hypothetical protein